MMSSTNVEFVGFAPSGVQRLEDVAIRLHPADDVAIARITIMAETLIQVNGEAALTVRQLIPSGHKIALRALEVGQPVRRYGQIIGFATVPVAGGDHVHLHNLGMQDFAREHQFGIDVHPVEYMPEHQRRTFMGYRRADGRVGTRNYIAVISTVNCSAHTCREVAHYFTPERLAACPNIDGVIALAHPSGCATQIGGADYQLLQRTLAGMAHHPNVAAYVIVGLGCESNPNVQRATPRMTIQDQGGVRKTIEAGIQAVETLLPLANDVRREPTPISELMVALQCGGSDGWSGVTANPLLGLVADELVRQGGSAVLAETPEIYGAEHLLTRRAISPEVGEKLIAKVRWWEEHARRLGIEIDNNPSVGNKAGGLTTIYEKSLGAVAKGGSMPLMGVYDYAEPVAARGFTFMDSPGYDPVSVTGQVAGGCNMVLFTTGRGSAFGFKPAPSIKVCTNTATYQRMEEDMDVNAGSILDGESLEMAATRLLDLLIAVASGRPSKSEAQGIGEAEFNPWNLGGTL
jgi:altronate hydrolase